MIEQEEMGTKYTDCCDGSGRQDDSSCCGGSGRQDDSGCCGGGMMEDDGGCCRRDSVEDASGCCGNILDSEIPDGSQEAHLESDSLEQLQKMVEEINDKYIRLYSEFDNFKKRTAKERMALIDKANEQALKELLPIIDDFERCLTVLQKDKEVVQQATQEGIQLIHDKLMRFLQKFNVEGMQLEPGTPFNPDLHEAIMQQAVESEEMKGKIISVVESGYLINTYVLRFAKVVIGV
ncbi:MAG: nucleotide exchange factor GrpE [Candidatus Cardinium sp.]|nr:nucleotide exchange factor GrpE [Candidatus Cardinium sp.]